jgi:urea transport system substrate-binding protein
VTENIIKVGILHSLTGHLAASETALCDAEFMAIAEINANGGVLGKQVIPVVKDGGSDSQIFVEKAIELIDREQVATVFGCWTSASRKAVLPIFESRNHLLLLIMKGRNVRTIFFTSVLRRISRSTLR